MTKDEMNAEEGEDNIELASKTADPPDEIMISRLGSKVNTPEQGPPRAILIDAGLQRKCPRDLQDFADCVIGG